MGSMISSPSGVSASPREVAWIPRSICKKRSFIYTQRIDFPIALSNEKPAG
jgi:hypothetical protein